MGGPFLTGNWKQQPDGENSHRHETKRESADHQFYDGAAARVNSSSPDRKCIVLYGSAQGQRGTRVEPQTVGPMAISNGLAWWQMTRRGHEQQGTGTAYSTLACCGGADNDFPVMGQV